MLAKSRVITTIAVHDLENAIIFYGEMLGLKVSQKNSEGVIFESGGGLLAIYQSGTAGTSQSTVAWWTVDDVEATVKGLKTHGIAFEVNYDLPHVPRKDDIYQIDDSKRAAWFRDPDGNILGFGNY